VHARQLFIAAAVGVLWAAQAAAEPAVVLSKINLRSGPGPAFATVAVLPPGTKLDVQKCTDDWCRVSFGRQTGYTGRALLKLGSESYAAAPHAAPADAKSAAVEPQVWQWNDSEWRDRHWRALEWHNRPVH
jgi:uncharacterized protein YraI